MEVLMKRVLVTSFVVLAGVSATKANAQEVGTPNYFEKQMAAPSSAFEIGLGGNYTQAWGNITDTSHTAFVTTPSRKIQDITGAGLNGELQLGWRFDPHWVAGIYGTFSGFNADSTLPRDTDIRSVSAGLQGTYFFRPYRVVSPWIGLASAWRGNWIVPEVGGITSRQGWEIARLTLGADLRIEREVSVGPYVGGALDVMFTEKLPRTDHFNLDSPPASFWFTAGLMGRFDIGGTYIQHAGVVASR
jgi:hypothetical protein